MNYGFLYFQTIINLKKDEHYRRKTRLFLLVFGFGPIDCPFPIQPILLFQQLSSLNGDDQIDYYIIDLKLTHEKGFDVQGSTA